MDRKKIRVSFFGFDSQNRPVYVDGQGTLWKDTDPRRHAPASLYTTKGDTLEWEPDVAMFPDIPVFDGRRVTW